MSDGNNPYKSPEADAEAVKPLIALGTLTETMLKHLSDASPWLRFLGIMGFIGSGMCVAGGLVCLVLMPFSGELVEEASYYFSDYMNIFGSALVIYALYFIGAGVVMFFPALFTYRFGARIRRYLETNAEQELEQALRNNKSLWKFQGILVIIGLAVIPLMIIIGIVIVVASLAIS